MLEGKEESDVKIVSLEGRMYPVEIAYLEEPVPDYVRKAAEVVMGIHMYVSAGPPGRSWLAYSSPRRQEVTSWSF